MSGLPNDGEPDKALYHAYWPMLQLSVQRISWRRFSERERLLLRACRLTYSDIKGATEIPCTMMEAATADSVILIA